MNIKVAAYTVTYLPNYNNATFTIHYILITFDAAQKTNININNLSVSLSLYNGMYQCVWCESFTRLKIPIHVLSAIDDIINFVLF